MSTDEEAVLWRKHTGITRLQNLNAWVKIQFWVAKDMRVVGRDVLQVISDFKNGLIWQVEEAGEHFFRSLNNDTSELIC